MAHKEASTHLLGPQVPKATASYLERCTQRFLQVAKLLDQAGDFPRGADVNDIIMLDRALMTILQLVSLPGTEASPTEEKATSQAQGPPLPGEPTVEAPGTEVRAQQSTLSPPTECQGAAGLRSRLAT